MLQVILYGFRPRCFQIRSIHKEIMRRPPEDNLLQNRLHIPLHLQKIVVRFLLCFPKKIPV